MPSVNDEPTAATTAVRRASPISCRGATMGPGDTCAKAGASATQSYEQRAQARRNAAPVIMVVGVLVMAFGVTLLITGRRRVAESR